VSSFLDRPTAERPASPSFNITSSSKILLDKDIQPSNLSFGFLGLGIMGSGIVKNLINSGKKLQLVVRFIVLIIT
jgi:3-hydroxyisobutyrate dehydrogenase